MTAIRSRNEEFRLYYASLSTDQQTIDIYVENNFGQMKQFSSDFNRKGDD